MLTRRVNPVATSAAAPYHESMIPLRDSLPSRSLPVVTIALIVINLLVFLYQGYLGSQPWRVNDWTAWDKRGLSSAPAFDAVSYRTHLRNGGDPNVYPLSADDYFIARYALIPAELLGGTDLPPSVPIPIWLTLLTSVFLHGGFWHLAGNMLYLWIFGDNVEDAMGHGRFLLFYLLCGVLAAAAQVLVGPNSAVPMIRSVRCDRRCSGGLLPPLPILSGRHVDPHLLLPATRIGPGGLLPRLLVPPSGDQRCARSRKLRRDGLVRSHRRIPRRRRLGVPAPTPRRPDCAPANPSLSTQVGSIEGSSVRFLPPRFLHTAAPERYTGQDAV